MSALVAECQRCAANDERFAGAVNAALHEAHKKHLSTKEVMIFGFGLLTLVLLGEGGAVMHYWSHGQGVEGMLIVTGWFRDFATEMVRQVFEA